MARYSKSSLKPTNKKVIFHGYILSCFIGIRWNMSPTGGMNIPGMVEVVKDYLSYAFGDNEWQKQSVLTFIKDVHRSDIKKQAKSAFPSLFNKGRQRPLKLPDELAEENISFETETVNNFRTKIQQIRQELNQMNDETNVMETPQSAIVETTANGVNIDELTLDNFSQMTGRRFRVTREQRDRIAAGNLTREGALEEYKNNLRNNG